MLTSVIKKNKNKNMKKRKESDQRGIECSKPCGKHAGPDHVEKRRAGLVCNADCSSRENTLFSVVVIRTRLVISGHVILCQVTCQVCYPEVAALPYL